MALQNKFLEDLYRRRGGIKLGIGTVSEAFAGIRKKNIPVYHVAGTNGKGTTVYAISHLLMKSGHNVGSFVSPHIVDFNERILFNGTKIDDEAVKQIFTELENSVPQFDELSFFEVTFLIAWKYYEIMGADRIVLEVGLGGRLDATNVIPYPKTDVITSIGLDHTQILGDTTHEIASEKLGIVGSGDIAVIGRSEDREFEEWMVAEAIKRGAKKALLNLGGADLIMPTGMPLSPEQKANLAIAAKAVELTEGAAGAPDFSALKLPGRYETRDNAIIDVAHNPPAIRALADFVAKNEGRVNVLYGAMKDKDIRSVFSLLSPVAEKIYIVHLDNGGDRGATVEYMLGCAEDQVRGKLRYGANADETIALAIAESKADDRKLLVTGSFFMLEKFLGKS